MEHRDIKGRVSDSTLQLACKKLPFVESFSVARTLKITPQAIKAHFPFLTLYLCKAENFIFFNPNDKNWIQTQTWEPGCVLLILSQTCNCKMMSRFHFSFFVWNNYLFSIKRCYYHQPINGSIIGNLKWTKHIFWKYVDFHF